MTERLNKVENRIVGQIAENMKAYGFPETIGIVMGTIYYEGRALSLDELSLKTGMSKTRMSQVLREMVQLNIAEKVFVKGTRKDYYTVEQDYYQTFISLFTSNWKRVISRNLNLANKSKNDIRAVLEDEEASEEAKAKAEAYWKEVKQIENFYDWLERLVYTFDSHQIFESVPKNKEAETAEVDQQKRD